MRSAQRYSLQRRLGIATALLVGVVLGLLTACGTPATDTPPTAVPTAFIESGASPLATVTSALTAVPAGSASPSPTFTPTTPLPTATLSPTATPSPQPTPCAEAGRVEFASFSSPTAREDHRYTVYLPPCYVAEGNGYPALYLMAGNIHDETKWLELGLDGAATAAIQKSTLPPLVIVMPDGGWLANNTSGGPGSYESVILDELIPHIEQSYCVWSTPEGRAIGGLSRGGYWALEIAFRFAERFASAGGHSAALLDSFAGPSINPQYTALNNNLEDLRIYLDIGAEDYLRTNTIQLHEEMQAAGVAHEWHLNEGQHVDAYWAEHVSDYLHWYAAPWPFDRDSYPPCDLTSSADAGS